MPSSSMLTVSNDRRSRSKSPSGRERDRDRDRSRSRDTRAKSPPKKEHRRSSKRYSESESESEDDDRRYKEKKSSRKQYEPELSDDDRRRSHTRSSKQYSESDSEEESDRYSSRTPRSAKEHKSRSSRRDPSVSEDDRRRERVRKDTRKKSSQSDSAEDDKRRHSKKSEKPSKKTSKESDESSGSEDISISIHRKSKSKQETQKPNGRSPSYAQPPPPLAYPPPTGYAPGYPPGTTPGYPPTTAAPGYLPPSPGGYHDARHMSYVGSDPRYAPPPEAYLAQPAQPVLQRSGSFSGGQGGASQRYANVEKFQYAQPDPSVGYKYKDDKRVERTPEKQYVKTYNSKGETVLMEVKQEYERERPGSEKYRERKYSDDSYERRGEKKYAEDSYQRRGEKKSADDNHERRGEKKYTDDNHERRGEKYADDKYDRRETKYVDDKYDRREKKSHNDDKYGSSPDEVTRKLAHLAVGGAAAGAATLAVAGHGAAHKGGSKPPASPLLEAYKGTYQSISPMPSALVLAKHKNDSDLSDLDLEESEESEIDSDDPNADLKRKIRMLEQEKKKHQKERHQEKTAKDRPTQSRENSATQFEIREPGHRGNAESEISMMALSSTSTAGGRKRVSFYDPTDDAKKIAAALEGTHRAPNVRPLITILPALTSDEIFALRAEYKNWAKVGGSGINMAKHIKARVPGNLGKAVYATALGRWESEAYWANSWYQSGATRRELLIESLMGRHNSDIREIKNCFKDKKYNDDLDKCMRAELKADKFRVAILLALEERRMTESANIDHRLVRADSEDLYRALTAPGGETAMIQIIVVRSDAHLREVLRVFERTYHINFAREMIGKSRNLVGETLAHILNGALNRPMRDALLLHQAIAETAPGKERAELLISRLVRLHWEPKHLERVKLQYETRYKMSVEMAVRGILAGMKTDEGRNWAEFCIELVRSSA